LVLKLAKVLLLPGPHAPLLDFINFAEDPLAGLLQFAYIRRRFKHLVELAFAERALPLSRRPADRVSRLLKERIGPLRRISQSTGEDDIGYRTNGRADTGCKCHADLGEHARRSTLARDGDGEVVDESTHGLIAGEDSVF